MTPTNWGRSESTADLGPLDLPVQVASTMQAPGPPQQPIHCHKGSMCESTTLRVADKTWQGERAHLHHTHPVLHTPTRIETIQTTTARPRQAHLQASVASDHNRSATRHICLQAESSCWLTSARHSTIVHEGGPGGLMFTALQGAQSKAAALSTDGWLGVACIHMTVSGQMQSSQETAGRCRPMPSYPPHARPHACGG